MPETKVKKRRKTAFEDSGSDSLSDEESDTEKEQQPTPIVKFANWLERSIDVDASNKARQQLQKRDLHCQMLSHLKSTKYQVQEWHKVQE